MMKYDSVLGCAWRWSRLPSDTERRSWRDSAQQLLQTEPPSCQTAKESQRNPPAAPASCSHGAHKPAIVSGGRGLSSLHSLRNPSCMFWATPAIRPHTCSSGRDKSSIQASSNSGHIAGAGDPDSGPGDWLVDGPAGSSGDIMGATSVVFRPTEVFCHAKTGSFWWWWWWWCRSGMAQVLRMSSPPVPLQERSLPGAADTHRKTWRRRCLLGKPHSARHEERKPD